MPGEMDHPNHNYNPALLVSSSWTKRERESGKALLLSAGSDSLGTGTPVRVLYAIDFSLKTQHRAKAVNRVEIALRQ